MLTTFVRFVCRFAPFLSRLCFAGNVYRGEVPGTTEGTLEIDPPPLGAGVPGT